ncbi:uncharacterized protein L3040_000334 [Drepanopeziza brunnea f. sp. 'multigermtubi']|uniref:uncharacterized protein n=1 Tax=Drepanopeziza brunnea f. sp. 'multigermtubi' TaxID=698441 RepID=UPI0023A12E9B|nr:hypothetical protein L3040_000334 [Drepanopeziza brunnea f. sp. 'multigermtubi']
MKPSYPSIRSFYKKEVPQEREVAGTSPAQPGDGFTEEELADALDPLSRKWNPGREYEETNIGQLVPGPHAVTFAGRVVNLGTFFGSSPKQPKATGFHSLIVKDDFGAISIKLYFARDPYPLKLGQLLTIWTVFISDQSKIGNAALPSVLVYANLFPGRVTSDHVLIHTTAATSSLCHLPLEYRKGQPLPGLMTLGTWLSGGHDGVIDAKILVVVKSIGAKKAIKRKDGGETEVCDIGVFDHSAECRMGLWGVQTESAKDWEPGRTVLLISNPLHKVLLYSGKGSVRIQSSSMVDVDPEFADAEWLRRYAVGLTRKESVKAVWPEGLWDVEAAESGVVRMLFTLAELDRWVRSDGYHAFTGFINVTIMDMSLVTLHRRNMLMCSECCGVPIFANSPSAPCQNCAKPTPLALNPRLLGTLLDETGALVGGKLLWSERAWEQLFGRSVGEVCAMSAEECRLFEQRALWMRLHLVVGWAGGEGDERTGGRLGVLGVAM